MKKSHLLLALMFFSFFANAKTSISGFVNMDSAKITAPRISLYKIDIINHEKEDQGSLLATAQIGIDGYFEFENTLLDKSDQVYKVELEWEVDANIDVVDFKYFIFSNTDSIYFHKSNLLLGNYSNTNLADLEWQKLNQLNTNEEVQNGIPQQVNYKNYLKDSLQILLVKLIGIRQLDDKMLLDKDIEENQVYYLSLLEELKSSNLEPSEYAHLENKLAMFTLKDVEQKYHSSLVGNFIAVCLIIGLLFYVFQQRKKLDQSKTIIQPQLSKQEQTIKELILEGKSNKEIANHLYISISTVKTHITNLYKKLGVSSRNEILMR